MSHETHSVSITGISQLMLFNVGRIPVWKANETKEHILRHMLSVTLYSDVLPRTSCEGQNSSSYPANQPAKTCPFNFSFELFIIRSMIAIFSALGLKIPPPDPASSTLSPLTAGYAVAQLVEALRYKSEGRGFDSRWCRWIFHWYNPSGRTTALGLTESLTEMNTRNISWG